MIREKDIQVLADCTSELVSRQLSSVEFVQDYVQLRFDGPYVTAMTLLTVSRGKEVLTSNDPGFRDALCGQIASDVVKVGVNAEGLALSFSNGAIVKVSLLEEHYQGPEAINYVTEDRWVVV